MDNIINNIENIEEYKSTFKTIQRLKINNFLNNHYAEELFKYAFFDKNWVLASGIGKNKYEKQDNPQNKKINDLQIKNVNTAFSKNDFSYLFYRNMNQQNMSYLEFSLRKILNSEECVDKLNLMTDLILKKLNT